MPRCVECGTAVERVVNPDTNTVEKCEHCGHSIDMYYEFGTTQKWIDIALLRSSAWAHVLFNERLATVNYVVVAILGCLLEAFVVRSGSVLLSTAAAGSASTTPLQLSSMLQNPLMEAMDYGGTLPRLLFYALTEYFLQVAVSVWVGNSFKARDAKYEEVLGHWVCAVSLASAVKLIYTLFLIWNIPMSVLPVVDCLFFVWLARGLSILSSKRSWLAIPGVLLCGAARMSFRHLTEWSPQILA